MMGVSEHRYEKEGRTLRPEDLNPIRDALRGLGRHLQHKTPPDANDAGTVPASAESPPKRTWWTVAGKVYHFLGVVLVWLVIVYVGIALVRSVLEGIEGVVMARASGWATSTCRTVLIAAACYPTDSCMRSSDGGILRYKCTCTGRLSRWSLRMATRSRSGPNGARQSSSMAGIESRSSPDEARRSGSMTSTGSRPWVAFWTPGTGRPSRRRATNNGRPAFPRPRSSWPWLLSSDPRRAQPANHPPRPSSEISGEADSKGQARSLRWGAVRTCDYPCARTRPARAEERKKNRMSPFLYDRSAHWMPSLRVA